MLCYKRKLIQSTMKVLLNLLLAFALVCPALMSGSVSKSVYAERIVDYVEDPDSLAYLDVEVYENDLDSIEVEELAEEYFDECHLYGDKTSYYDYYRNDIPYPFENVEEDVRAGNFKKVLADAEKVLTDYPDASDGKYYAAYAHFFLKDYRKAIDIATDLAADFPSDSGVNNLLGVVAEKDSQYALPLAEKKIDQKAKSGYYVSSVDSISALHLMAHLAKENGYFYNALEYLDKLENKLESWSDEEIDEYGLVSRYDIAMYRVVIHMSMGEYETALKLLDSMGEEDHTESWYYNRFGTLRGAYGLESALNFEKEALVESPYIKSYVVSLIADLTLAEKYDEAIAKVDDFIESDLWETEDLPELYLRRGIAKKLSGKDDEAEKDFIKVVELSEDGYVGGPEIYAKCYLGQKDEVLSDLDQNDDNFQASIYNVLGMTDKALEKLGVVYEKCKWNPIRSKYDIHQRSLVSHPSFPKIAAKFQPAKRRF